MDEDDLITKFMRHSKCSREDAKSCLRAWNYDLKKALIDFNGNNKRSFINCCPISIMSLYIWNYQLLLIDMYYMNVYTFSISFYKSLLIVLQYFSDTSTQNYFKTKNKEIVVERIDDSPQHIHVFMDDEEYDESLTCEKTQKTDIKSRDSTIVKNNQHKFGSNTLDLDCELFLENVLRFESLIRNLKLYFR